MNKFIKVLTTIVITLLLTVVVFVPKSEAAISGENVSELRGVWVSTVSNIDITTQKGTGEKAIKDYQNVLLTILDKVESTGLNAIFFQIRPANDALYESKYNVWSEFLAGYGVNPGWDMLSWFIEKAHERGIELHAWLNPYRVTASSVTSGKTAEEIEQIKLDLRAKTLNVAPNIDNPLTIMDDEEFLGTVVNGAEGKLILNPAREKTISHIEKTISEIIENYDVDGIHFDDYFYPSGGIESKYDTEDYNAYVSGGGTLGKADWRRSNVDKMVERVHNLIDAYNVKNPSKAVAFGISPAAVWAADSTRCPDRGQPGGMNVICGSYSAYTDLYADTKKWVEEEWLDYILPQVYYNYGDDYKEIVNWWAKVVSKTNVKLYVGTAIYRAPEWQDGLVVQKQFDYLNSTEFLKRYVSGFVLFSYRNLVSSDQYLVIANNSLKNYCLRGALHPTYGFNDAKVTEKVDVEIYKTTTDYIIKFNEVKNANGYVIYGVPKGTTEINFADPSIPIKQAFNQTNSGKSNIITVTQKSVANFDFVLRIYDLDNNPHDYVIIKFDNASENEGPTFSHNIDTEKVYNVGENIVMLIEVDSPAELPVSAQLHVSVNGGNFMTNYNLEDNGDGTYSYKYTTIKDGTVTFKFIINDGDVEKEIIVGPITVGKGLNNDGGDGKTDTDTPPTSSMNCNFGTLMILPMIAACGIFILRKREF
ncbi:MAG: family 10 glycosylhydrolase [Bacilli bacterium]|nr:family 10 glycosylhydrolase [Bacilli bacterium]